MFNNLFSDVVQNVEKWSPKKAESEAEFRDDLMAYLRQNLAQEDLLGGREPLSIRKETGRHLADIGIDGKVGIELKYNLNTKSKVDRLFGQIDDYLTGYDSVVIVLCGKTSDDQLDYLKEKVRKMPSKDMFSSKNVEIIVKDGKKLVKKKDPLDFDIPDPFTVSDKKRGSKNQFSIFLIC